MEDNPERAMIIKTNSMLKYRHNIDLDQYNSLWDAQEGKCGICGKQKEKREELCVDHDHQTQRIRGLLCSPCNRAIGTLGDDTASLRLAISYLKNYEK